MPPSAALRELEVCPWPLLVDVLSSRAYVDTRRYLEQHPDEYPDSEMADVVREIQDRVGRAQVAAAVSSTDGDGR